VIGPSLLHAVFVVSGACGLGCQVVWTRMLGLGLGQEMPAVLAVVAAFFGGFALGARVSDGLASRAHARLAWLYAALELIIGFWVLASPGVIPAANRLALDWIGLEPSGLRHAALAFGVPFLALLPATAAMGATLAAMEDFARGLSADGRVVGSLYAANTLGAALGALAVLELAARLGFAGTLLVLGVLNLGCAAAAAFLGRSVARGVKPAKIFRPESRSWASGSHWAMASPGSQVQGTGRAVPELSPARLKVLLLATGLLGIGLEVLVVRVLKLVLEDTVYTFACLLAVYLLGTALGAAAIKRCAARWPAAGRVETLLAGLAAACVLGGWAMTGSPALYATLRRALGDSFQAAVLSDALVATLVFLPASLLMGATFASLAQTARDAGFGLGRALAWNTLGGALAPVLAGVLVLPLLGAKWTLAALAAGYLALALAAARRWRAGWVLAPLALAFGLLPDLRLVQLRPDERLRVLREGVSDSVAVIETADGHRTLRVNNRFTMGGTASANAERRQAHIPLLLHPGPKRALFLGSGTGITAAAAAAHPDLRVESVELVPEIVAVMPEFAPANAAPPDRLRQFTADARRFVRATTNHYDVIVADLFHPARDGAGALYTREHFQAIRDRLAPGGLFCQWVPLYQTDERTLRAILGTFRAVFSETRLWLLRLNLETPVVGLTGRTAAGVANPESLYDPLDDELFAQQVNRGGLRNALRELGLGEPAQLASLLVSLAPDQLPAEVQATDNRPVVAFLAPRAGFTDAAKPYATLFKLLEWARVPRLDEQDWPGLSAASLERLQSILAARDKYLGALRLEAEGRPGEAREALVESARLSADFTTGYAHAITLAVQMSRDNPAEARRLLERLAAARPELPVARSLIQRLFSDGAPAP
jgi:spermidine synthase